MDGLGTHIVEGPSWVPAQVAAMEMARATDAALSVPRSGTISEQYRGFLGQFLGSPNSDEMVGIRRSMEKSLAPVNAQAKAFRANARQYQTTSMDGNIKSFPSPEELFKSGEIAKSVLDVGNLTNFANITGGQSLGYVSLDTRVARGTIRPQHFTLYKALNKTVANQIVDYWAYLDDTGGAIPGAAFGSYSAVSSGALSTNIGNYSLQNVQLKLMLDARAMTVALAAQNSFSDIATQESANAALTILSSADWAAYYGNSTLYANQFNGLDALIPAANKFDFQAFYNTQGVANSWSVPQAAYNFIYECAGKLASFGTYGRTTHAFMSPQANASLQSLITTTLNNVVSMMGMDATKAPPGIIVNGDLQGMRTRFGQIQFVLDTFINARLAPIQSIVLQNGTNKATTTAPTPPTSITPTVVAASGMTATSYWTTAYGGTGSYVYAAAGMGPNSEESQLTYSSVVASVPVGGGVSLAIVPNAAADNTAVRIFRSGLGYAKTGGANTPYSFRLIASVAATGTSTITYVDTNAVIPGGESIFLLDLADEDDAIDFRFMLPLSKIELYAQNLYMPWAVAMIGALRLKIPKWHGQIVNFVPNEVNWNPLAPNN